MTQSRKRALFTLSIWVTVMIVFAVSFFCWGGPYAEDKLKRLFMGLLLGSGYISFGLMMYLTRARSGAAPMVTDERDEQIARQANGTALVVVLLYVFLICIVLFEAHHDTGMVPVGWMWFLAYSTGCCGYTTHATATLILDSRMARDGEG